MTVKVKTEAQERKESFVQMIFWCAMWLFWLQYLTGCMQLSGAKKIDAWGLVIEANNGFEAKAGIQQYDFVSDTRGIGLKQEAKAMTPGKAD